MKTMTDRFPRFTAAMYACKHDKDPDYLKKVIQTDPTVFQFHEFGDKNSDLNIYMIKMGDRGDGFFAEYNRLLMYLYVADRFHFTPVVQFSEEYLYHEDHMVNGSDNPYQYYFLQPAGIEPYEAQKSRNVVFSQYVHTLLNDLEGNRAGIYGYSDRYIMIMGDIDAKYIRMNPIVSEFVEKGIDDIIGECDSERIIGVHFRGTDYRKGLNGHPEYMTPERQIEKVNELLATGKYDKIFLATDDTEALKAFKNCFGKQLSYYDDVFRSSSDTSVAFSINKRENHHYMLGLEVLRDMETLSRCGSLVAGLSQVSLAARIHKSGFNKKYRDLCIIDTGVVEKGMDLKSFYNSVEEAKNSWME